MSIAHQILLVLIIPAPKLTSTSIPLHTIAAQSEQNLAQIQAIRTVTHLATWANEEEPAKVLLCPSHHALHHPRTALGALNQREIWHLVLVPSPSAARAPIHVHWYIEAEDR